MFGWIIRKDRGHMFDFESCIDDEWRKRGLFAPRDDHRQAILEQACDLSLFVACSPVYILEAMAEVERAKEYGL